MATPAWRAPIEVALHEKEFKCYSQFGDDGIIQYLVQRLPVRAPRFIEFGVGDYFESNTHFLLVNSNWAGLVLDGSAENVRTIRSSPIYWRHDLQAKCAFVTRDNVRELLAEPGFEQVGLLHIDLDGNDYWILESLDFAQLRVDILVLEYNAVFGSERAITVPYDDSFNRFAAHHSGLYWGASLPALVDLATRRGFFFAGTNSAGNNAYFIDRRHGGALPEVGTVEGFTDSRYRESRNERFEMSFVSGAARQALIRGLPVWNVGIGAMEPF